MLLSSFVLMQHATYTIVFSCHTTSDRWKERSMNYMCFLIDGKNEGVYAFVCPLRDEYGRECPGMCIADCRHKIGLNGVDNGRIW